MANVYIIINDNKLGVLYWAWIGLGVWFGVAIEKFEIIDSLLFSLTALTTAGVIDPRNNDLSYWLTSAYILIGIPLHGLFWGSVVDWMILGFLTRYADEEVLWLGRGCQIGAPPLARTDQPSPRSSEPDEDEEPPKDYNCYGVAESRIKKKRYSELYTIVSNAMNLPLDNIEGEREV